MASTISATTATTAPMIAHGTQPSITIGAALVSEIGSGFGLGWVFSLR
jgi:hypothetical protein